MILTKFGENPITTFGEEDENLKKFTHDARRTTDDGRRTTHDGRRTKSDRNSSLEPSAQVS